MQDSIPGSQLEPKADAQPLSHQAPLVFFFLRFYPFIHETETETQAEGEAGSL